MLNSSQFSGGPNPALMVVGALQAGLKTAESITEKRAKLKRLEERVNRRKQVMTPATPYDEAMTQQEHTEKTITPIKEQEMATHPWTGEKVPRTPVKRSNYKKTPPGTKPKKK